MSRLTRNILILLLPVLAVACRQGRPALLTGEVAAGGGNTLPVYTGDSLRNIFYPLGGMGTGNILVGGRGNILEWEIFNRAQRDELPPYMTFFSIWCREEGSEPVSRVLERRHFDDFANGFGVPRQQLAGLPRFEEAAWSGAPPLVSIKLEDNTVPLEISLECFNPLIPLAVDASSYPAGEFNWIVRNPGKNRVDFSLAFFLSNPFRNLNYRGNEPGYPVRCSSLSDASRNTGDSPGLEAGATGNRPGSWNGLFLENLVDPASPDFGNMAVASDHPGMVLNTGLVAERWWDDAHLIWGRFSEDGGLAPREEPVNHTGRGEVVSSLLARGTLEPGGTDTVRFLVAWYVPNRELEESQAFGSGEIAGHVTRNYYSLGFKDAREVMHRYLDERRELHRLSDRFRERMAASTVPGPVLDAAASNLAILKSNLVSRMENGDLHGYEGLGPDFGCCPGNCTHVWNYAQSLASLFPSLERNVRETAYLTQTFESGYQCFRTTFPIGDSHFRNVAADGQMGNIMRAYREWKFSGDSTWLARLWPAVKRSLEYAWSGTIPGSRENEWQSEGNAWDPGRRGVLSGKQHNTYDVDFYGPNMLTGSLYLGALKACSEMARYLADPDSVLFSEVYRSGRHAYDSLLWNGSWYVQLTEPGHDRYQYGRGCLSDQLLGQYLAFNSGLGYLLDPEKVKTCLKSIHRHNFVKDFSGYHNVQRVYALNREGGLVLCSWPGGERELIPFPYADEVWTGVEYQAASSMVRAGLVTEGLQITRAVRDRYAGYNRNPYAEIESGFYYARALSSWSVFLALSGFSYDGTTHSMTFDPYTAPDGFRAFWSTGSGWGNYENDGVLIGLEVDFGQLSLLEFRPGVPVGTRPEKILVNGRLPDPGWEFTGGIIRFKEELHLRTNDKITIYLTKHSSLP